MITIDTSRSPLIITTASGCLSDNEYILHLAELTAKTVNTMRPYAYVYDGRSVTKMAASTRRIQADWINAHRENIAQLCVGCAFVFDAGTRLMLTAIHWISPPPYQYYLTGDFEDAAVWALDQLHRHGIALSRSVVAK